MNNRVHRDRFQLEYIEMKKIFDDDNNHNLRIKLVFFFSSKYFSSLLLTGSARGKKSISAICLTISVHFIPFFYHSNDKIYIEIDKKFLTTGRY